MRNVCSFSITLQSINNVSVLIHYWFGFSKQILYEKSCWKPEYFLLWSRLNVITHTIGFFWVLLLLLWILLNIFSLRIMNTVVILDIRSNAYKFFFKFLTFFLPSILASTLIFIKKKNQTTWQQETKIEI